MMVKLILILLIISGLCYPQKAFRKNPNTTEKRETVRPDSSEIPVDFEFDLSKLDNFQRKEFFKNLSVERSKIPTYFNIGVNVIQNFPREIKYIRYGNGPLPNMERVDILTGKGKSSIGFGGHIEFAFSQSFFMQLGYNHSTFEFELDSLGYSAGTVTSKVDDILFAFSVLAGPVRINIGDAFSISKNGFNMNMYGGLGINLYKGLSLSANYQLFGLGMIPPKNGSGYIKDLKETDRYLYTSTAPEVELAYQHLSSFQLTLSIDLFFSAKEQNKNKEDLATYRAWKSVALSNQYIDDLPLQLPVPAQAPVKTISYTKYSDKELETMLNEAVAKEQFDTAENIQNEINRRNTEKQHADLTTMSDAQLQTKLTEAIQKEDYETADKIQKEMKRREAKKIP